MKFLPLIAATLLASSTTSAADTCTNLCSTADQTLKLKSCADQTVSAKPDSPCCDDGTGASTCPDGRKCRSVVFSTAMECSAPGQADPCIMPARVVEMSTTIYTQAASGTCCSNCHCNGDPHCYPFVGKPADFIMCDARNAKSNCDLSQSLCATQKDYLGNDCAWTGGRCERNAATPAQSMLFYKKDTTSVSFTLGERGIITDVAVVEGANTLTLNANDCKSNSVNPWVGTPIGIMQRQKFGKVWIYQLNAAKASLTVNCVYQGTLVKSAHLDVQIVAQGVKPGFPPAGVSGYCANGIVDYGKATHDITDAIQSQGLCNTSPVASTAVYFNGGRPVSQASLPRVVMKFCKKYMISFNRYLKGKGLVKKCYKNILGKDAIGFNKVYCAANTLLTKDPAECTTNDCMTCLSDIQDFGWTAAIQKWDASNNKNSGGATCISISQLPPDLTECQRGIRIQYMDSTTKEWTTYKAIPSGYTLCSSSGSFNSNDDPVLFQNLIRFTQCDLPTLPPGTCPDQDTLVCDANDGFTVSVSTKVKTEVPALDIVTLVDKGTLICNPAKYPKDPTGCLNIPLNPCPTCTGKCADKGYVSPCGDATKDTCSMCLDPFAMFSA